MRRSVHATATKSRSRAQKWVLILIACIIAFTAVRKGMNAIGASVLLRAQPLAIALSTDPATLLYVPTEGESLIISIPSDVYVQVPFGFGSYRIGTVSKLGNLQKRPELLAKTIEGLLGVPTNHWISPNDSGGNISPVTHYSIQLLSSFRFVSYPPPTNLSIVDRLLLWWRMLRTPAERITLMDLGDSNALVRRQLVDGSVVYEPDLGSIDQFLEHVFEQSLLRDEQLSVTVRNASTTVGVGQLVARLLTRSGIKVVTVGNSDEHEACTLRGSGKHQSTQTVRFVTTVLPCIFVSDDGIAEDLELIIGSSYAKYITSNE